MNRQEKALRYAHKVILHEVENGRTPELLLAKNGGKGFGCIEDAINFRRTDVENSKPLWFLIIVLVAAWATDSFVSEAELKGERTHYCEMVDLYASSDGENGWPDYKKVYDEECGNE